MTEKQDLNKLTPFTDMGEVEKNENTPTEMMIVGVGGGGSNAVRNMYTKHRLDNIRYVVCNTDSQALEKSGVPTQLLLGPNVTKGRGAGNRPEVARQAAEESEEDIRALFASDPHPNMVFVTAGMGGGTGTGAAPIVARIAKELDILTVGIVTIPFLFEGMPKIQKALTYIDELRKHVDALLIINNERLYEIYPSLTIVNAFSMADDILSVAAGSIIEIIVREGYMNCDFCDVRSTLLNGGTAIISTGYGEGENRVTAAIEDAIRSPLLKNADIYSAKNLLVAIFISPEEEKQMTVSESGELSAFTRRFVNTPDVITGIYFDEEVGDKMKITILAAGFNDSNTTSVPKQQPTTGKNSETPQVIEEDNTITIETMYSPAAVREMKRKSLQLAILTPEQMDNDALLEMFDNEPTYSRSTDFKQRFATASVARSVENAPTENNIKIINFDD